MVDNQSLVDDWEGATLTVDQVLLLLDVCTQCKGTDNK